MSMLTKSGDAATQTSDRWDQTDSQWLINLRDDQLGTGLFLIKDTESNEISKSHKSDIAYSEFKIYARLQQAVAIKWVPHTIGDEATVLRLICNGYCEETCVQPGCICDTDNHRCV